MNKTIIMMLLAALFGATAAQAYTDGQTMARQIKQDANLYQVDEKLFRSEQLQADDAATVRALGIKTIVNLRYFSRGGNHKLFSGSDILLLNRPLLTWRVKPEQIADILWTIEQRQQHGAVLVHCYHGADRTGTIIAMYRIIYQNWDIARAKHEMQQGPFGYHSIWKNLDGLFTESGVAAVKTALQRRRQAAF